MQQVSATEVEVAALCSAYGTVIECRVLRDSVTGRTRGSAFVLFDRRAEAEEARAGMYVP